MLPSGTVMTWGHGLTWFGTIVFIMSKDVFVCKFYLVVKRLVLSCVCIHEPSPGNLPTDGDANDDDDD